MRRATQVTGCDSGWPTDLYWQPTIVSGVTDEMLVAQPEWLPQYRANGSIDAAKQRLADHERNGTRVKTRQTQGAARVHTKTVEEMARDKEAARKNAAAADIELDAEDRSMLEA